MFDHNFLIDYSHVKYMRTFNVRSDKFVFFAIITILFASAICVSAVSALPQQQIGVKITNPAKGQQTAKSSVLRCATI